MISERLAEVRQRMGLALAEAGRADSVELVIVTKNHPAELVSELVALGERNFGENKDQEASAKALRLRELLPGSDVAWHFVGQLQSNKVKSMLSYAGTLHSLDRDSLLKELAKQLEKIEGKLDAFIELNLTDDPGRGGIQPEHLLGFTENVLKVDRINLLGVMGVAGLGIEPKIDFERIRQASELVRTLAPAARYISMGMSQDFEPAILSGATHIRVGTAITGPRP